MAEPVDLFAVLGVDHDADEATIRRAYRRLARTHHPDAGGDPEAFARISRAYETLRRPAEREALARRLRRPGTSGPAAADPAGRGRPHGGPGAGGAAGDRPRAEQRLSQAEQDRLVDEFVRSHPDWLADGRGRGPGAPAPRPRPGRWRQRLTVTAIALVAGMVLVGLTAPELLASLLPTG